MSSISLFSKVFSLALALGGIASIAADATATAAPASAQLDLVLPYSTEVYTVTLAAHELSQIVVDGDGSSDLDLYVYDQNGNLVGSDLDLTDFCVVSIVPRWTGSFRIEVRNRGGVSNLFTIRVI